MCLVYLRDQCSTLTCWRLDEGFFGWMVEARRGVEFRMHSQVGFPKLKLTRIPRGLSVAAR